MWRFNMSAALIKQNKNQVIQVINEAGKITKQHITKDKISSVTHSPYVSYTWYPSPHISFYNLPAPQKVEFPVKKVKKW